ncbi:MAG: AAA family ATPase [Candidatus Pacebacteria bacterium]|nr:AAA family ATPase [Candidatus Paceibacterota bacterium]
MKTLKVRLENCYGIAKLDEEFKFEKSYATLIYAPNGVMKTSFAKTFYAISKGKQPEEKMFNKTPSFDIKADGVDILQDDILVINPFDKNFESVNISTLLVNLDKKLQYDGIFKDILNAKKKLVIELNKISKIPKESIESQLAKDLGCDDIFSAIRTLQQLGLGNEAYFSLQYQTVFDPKVVELLGNEEVRNNIAEYAEKYNSLFEESTVFKRGIFNPAKASSVSTELKKQMFFEAKHKVILDGKVDPIDEHKVLEQSFEAEKEKILGNGSLQEISKKIIGGVASIKAFQDVLESCPEIAAELANVDNLRKIVWCSYYETNKVLFDDLLAIYEKHKQQLIDIENAANLESTLWHKAHRIFKERFQVPFSMEIANHTNAILGTTKPVVVFTFNSEDGTPIKFNRGELDSLDFLSMGERRAMYLLYVIFELLAKQASQKQAVIIIDDIADSFDYKNKYAIIEYLKELAHQDLFRLIVLTHNFDFYRTFQGRVLDNAQWENSFIAQKTEGSIKLLRGGDKDVSNPFTLWKKNYHKNGVMLISMIPFVRNLIEYRDGTKCDEYKRLTSMLHIKDDTSTLKLSDLESLISGVVKGEALDATFDQNLCVLNHIYNTADELCNIAKEDEICLENKIALSIAARLKAEEYMWSVIKDKSSISGSQTGRLYDRWISENDPNDVNFVALRGTLSQVILMTPENIHLNSFMYEPLMDMSSHHLVKLYQELILLH